MSTAIRPQPGPRLARHRSSPWTRIVVLVTILGAGVAAIPVGASPTGNRVGDEMFTFAFAALVAGAASYGRRWTWPILAAGAAAVADGTTLLVVAALAVATAVVGLALNRRERVLGALIGAAAVQVLLRQPSADVATYLPSLIAAVIVIPAVASAYQNGPHRLRRRIHFGIVFLVLWTLLGAVGLGLVASRARSDVRSAIDLSFDGLDAGERANQQEATELLDEANERFESARAELSSPLSLPARLLPILGNNANALLTATEQGASLTGSAATTAALVDLDEVTFANGRLDLEVIKQFDLPLETAAAAVETALVELAKVDSPWLLGPIDSRLQRFVDQLDGAAPSLRNAADVVHISPSLLGDDAPRTYLVLFFTPSELRGLGGFIGGFAELRADNGALELIRTGRPAEINELLDGQNPALDGPADYLDVWGQYQPQNFFQDISLSPHFPSVADAAAQLYDQATGVNVDGVIALGPEALAGFTEFTGPVKLGGQRLGPRQLGDFLLNGQYLEFRSDEEEREDLLDAALRTVFTDLLTVDMPSPRALAQVLGPIVNQGRLMIVVSDTESQKVLDRIGISGAIPSPDGSDFLAVVSQNAANNKIDYFLERGIDYSASVGNNGRIDATVTVDMTNAAPIGGADLPTSIIGSNDRGLELGLNRSLLTVYTPHRLESATLDGAKIGARQGVERGLNVYSFTVDISAGQRRALELTLLGTLGEPANYRLTVAPQPTVRTDQYTIAVTTPGRDLSAELSTAGDVVLFGDS